MGQGHVTRTLQNALQTGRVAHGYLFTGTRGTAKTTVARLLAKALNCEATDHPAAEPCNRCAACVSITAGSSIDVIEMDAASHRGVADIEEVRKSVSYGPMELRYKVFIIDEAHQLSSDAKDAFLKTLEEPPANVVFILATTEPQAIPITIRSRCQQFDFKRGSLTEITSRLKYVLDCEAVTYAPDAINLIARGAEGSYRDSLSLLEQVLAFAPKHITGADVDTVLGTLDSEMLAHVTGAIARRDAPATFALAGDLLDAGKEARTLLRTLSAHFRDLLLVSVGGPAVAAELAPDEVARLQAEARAFTPPQMMRAMDILNEAQGETRWNNQHRLLVELTFLKLMSLGDTNATPFATAPIVFSNAPAVAAPVVPQPVAVAPPVVTSPVAAPIVVPPAAPLVTVTAPVVAPPPVAASVVAAPTPAVAAAPVAAPADDALTPAYFGADETDDEDDYDPSDADDPDALLSDLADEDDEDTSTPPAAMLAPVATVAAPPVAAPAFVDAPLFPDDDEDETGALAGGLEAEPVDDSPGLFDDEPEVALIPVIAPTLATSASAPAVAEVADEDTSEPLAPAVADFALHDVEAVWPDFLQKAGVVSKKTQTMMLRAFPSFVGRDGTVEITFRDRPNHDIMSQPKSQEFVRELLKRCLGVNRVGVRFTLDSSAAPAPPARPAGADAKKKITRDPFAALDALDSPPREDNYAVSRPASDSSWGYGSGSTQNGSGYPLPAAPVAPPPPPASSFATAPASPRPVPPPMRSASPASNGYGNGNGSSASHWSGDATADTRPVAASTRDKALAQPLVQDILSAFGGEIIED